MRARLVVSWLLGVLCPISPSSAAGPNDLFNQASVQDLQGHPHLAYRLYRRAAEAGQPDAEFNVAVMLDSGRGVIADVAQAAVWYARAASHGRPRAAYNLGQLYEAGEGVPRNGELARAWFASSGLPAAHARRAAPPIRNAGRLALTPPTLVSPAADARLDAQAGGVELVWTALPQPEPVRYRIDLQALDEAGPHRVATVSTRVSSLFAALSKPAGRFAWRVTVVGSRTGRDAASGWRYFDVSSAARQG